MRCGPFLVMLALCSSALLRRWRRIRRAWSRCPSRPTPSRPRSTSGPKRCRETGRGQACEPSRPKPGTPKPAARQARHRQGCRREPRDRQAEHGKNARRAEIGSRAKTGSRPNPNEPSPNRPTAGRRDVVRRHPARRAAGDPVGAAVVGRLHRRGGGDDPMLTAIKNFQKRHKAKVTGVLTPAERADAARRRQGARGGIRLERGRSTRRPASRIGLPTKLVPHRARRRARHALVLGAWRGAGRDLPHQGCRLKLAALFEQEKKEPATRKVETSALHDDNFFISGMQGLKKFSVRAQLRDGEVRGFTMLYDQAMEAIVAPVMAAMAAAFAPFPERSAPFARAGEIGRIRHRADRERARPHRHRPQADARLPGDRRRRPRRRRPRRRRTRTTGWRCCASMARASSRRCRWRRRRAEAGELTLVGIPDPKEQDGAASSPRSRRGWPTAARSSCASRCRWRDFPAPPRSTPGPLPRHDGDAQCGAGQRRGRGAAGAARHRRRPSATFLDSAARGAGAGAERRRQGVGGADYLREEVIGRVPGAAQATRSHPGHLRALLGCTRLRGHAPATTGNSAVIYSSTSAGASR